MAEQKTALVLRWGGFGDHIQSTPVLRALKQDGYHVTMHTNGRGLSTYKNNPNIDEIIEYVDDSIPQGELEAYWNELGSHYDKFVNLSGIVEGGLLKSEYQPEDFRKPSEERRRECNKNYIEAMLDHAGYPDASKNCELFPTEEEEKRIQGFIRNKLKNKFVILWSLAGSAFHKAYPWAEEVAVKFLNRHEDAVTITVGDNLCSLLEWEHKRNLARCGELDIRTSMLMTKYVSLVVGTETGVLNAAGCFDTPKVILLSHSTPENLTKYWNNVTPIHASVPCYPCHQLHYTRRSCPCDKITGAPACMVEIPKDTVFNAIEYYYRKWKGKR